ncbi:MAG: ferric reductase-like transmembrane domain-containing protein [Pseudomonadota bacterium]|jgi:sulfoxide reductase heme-binding subunit YedZ
MSEVSDAARHGLLRRTARRALLRHLCVAALTAVLLAVFAAVHAQWSPMHRWNRAFGDASLVLVALSMGLGPLVRFVRPATPLLAFRRELGIHGCLLALVHAAIILVGWVQWDLMRLFGFELHPDLLVYVMFQPGFGLANLIGLAALVFVALLAATSSDMAMSRLGVSGWKFLQMGVLPLWWLSVSHVAYFLFMHFLSFHRPLPDPNPLRFWFVGLVIGVAGLRFAAYVRTVLDRQRPGPAEGRRAGAPI